MKGYFSKTYQFRQGVEKPILSLPLNLLGKPSILSPVVDDMSFFGRLLLSYDSKACSYYRGFLALSLSVSLKV